MDSTTLLSSQELKNNSVTFLDASSKSLIVISQENGKLIYNIIRSQNHSSRISTDRLPPLLRQFTNLSQLSAFFRSGNMIKAKKGKDQQDSLEILLPCQGGMIGVPILILFAVTTIAIAADHWIFRPQTIKPLRKRTIKNGNSLSNKNLERDQQETKNFASDQDLSTFAERSSLELEQKSQSQQNQERAEWDEKIQTGERMYLLHIHQGLEINDTLKSQIKTATNFSDRSIEKLILKLIEKYPAGSDINPHNRSRISDLSDLSSASETNNSSLSSFTSIFSADEPQNID